jgi:MFS family permease
VRLPFFYGWIVVAVAFATMAVGVNARTAFSLLFPAILDEFGWERGVTAAAFSLGFIVSMAFTPLLGRLMDRWGPRRVMPVAVLTISVGLALATLARRPWHLYATQGLLVGAGSICAGYTGHAFFLPNWFVRRRGVAMGIAFSGVGIGSVVLFPWLQALIARSGWRSACWALAVLLLGLVPLNFYFQRRRPEDLGLAPDGDGTRPGTGLPGTHPENVVDPVWVGTEWTLARAARTGRFWCVFVGFFCGLFAWYAVQAHQTKYLLEIGFAPATAAYALGLVGLLGIVGQIALGHFSDRVGREWAWTASLLGFLCCYATLLVMKTSPMPALLYLMVAAQGVGYGLASVYGAIPAELFHGRHYGAVFGVLGFASGLGAGVGPWIAGAVHDRTGSYALAFWMAIALSLVSVIAIWLAAPRKVRAVAGRVSRRRSGVVGRTEPA